MDRQRLAAAALAVALLFAAATDYVPQFRDDAGKVFGLFALDIYKDALHIASGLWAAAAAFWSRRASELFLRIFGALYLVDGNANGSGSSRLYKVALDTGLATPVGNTGVSSLGALGAIGTTLYATSGAGELYTLNRSTGVSGAVVTALGGSVAIRPPAGNLRAGSTSTFPTFSPRAAPSARVSVPERAIG